MNKTWKAHERKDESCYLEMGNPRSGLHMAFDVACDINMAKKLATAMNLLPLVGGLVATEESLDYIWKFREVLEK